jgi:DNA-binding transcriptional MerR regulator
MSSHLLTPSQRQAEKLTGGEEKLFYKIGEVSVITGLEPYVLRYWQTEFPVLHPRKSRGGQRIYLKKDVETILRIKQMLYEEGYTISGARHLLGKKAQENKSSGSHALSHAFLIKLRTNLADILRIVSPHGEKGSII